MSELDDAIKELNNLSKKGTTIPTELSVLPLRDVVIYPYMIFPVLIGRASTLKAVAEAIERDKYIFVALQKYPNEEEPKLKDIYNYGTIAKIIQVVRLPNNMLKVLVEGLFQAKIKKRLEKKECLEAVITPLNVVTSDAPEMEALVRKASDLFKDYIKKNLQLPQDLITAFENITDPVRKLYFAAANVNQNLEGKQKILQTNALMQQYFQLITLLTEEIELLQLEDDINVKVQETLQKTQRKYYLQEQIRILQKELGDEEEASPELAQIKEDIEKAQMPEAVKNKALEEFDRLKKTPTLSPEYSVNRTYLELLTSVPWIQRTDDNYDIEHVHNILDEDHYDLDKPKERILEYIAILNLAGSLKRQILCFVGPPGVGKTSLGRSIARALGRKFVRFSLGGIRDEAEIRGHRRTYVGALPGKIIQSMKKAGTINPVILLDEVDKMSMDFRGDPSSALLEVLDPEQNIAFNDHYLEVDYDLSNVLFITTANIRYDIPLPLQDRMEIIELTSYLEPEKVEIAKRHILPRLLNEYGLSKLHINFSDDAIRKIITEYTREAGVRKLEQQIASVLRKLTKEIVLDFEQNLKKDNDKDKNTDINNEQKETDKINLNIALKDNPKFQKKIKNKKYNITPKLVEDYLKAPRYKDKKDELIAKVGVVVGLAWTSVGGEVMPIEATIMPGSEKLTLTGKLGDVMKESAIAGLSYIRSNYEELDISSSFNKKKEIHIHIPEGAIPKDGPSAGITMAIAMISAANGKKVRGDVAMTGEITLRGNILPIGGLKEKLLAAKRYNISTVIIPKENERDVQDIPDNVKEGLNIIPVSHIREAMPIVFVD